MIRHLALGLVSLGSTAALMLVLHRDFRERFSTATAYVGLVLLAVTLALGPLNVLRRRPNPVSFNLRRDFGLWSAFMGVTHSVVGLTVHFRGRMHLYFVPDRGQPAVLGLRADLFGLANDTGLMAAMLLLVLAVISNDIALRTLGTGRWRTIQRSAYLVAALVILHGVLYQAIEHQRWWLVAVLGLTVAAGLGLQSLGFRATRRRRADP
jgi:sulfoxide reductase heme-binding subunit YedZ